MINRTEHNQNVELFRGSFYDFQDAVSEAKLMRLDPIQISHSRNLVVLGWQLFSEVLNGYAVVAENGESIKNSGIPEVIKCLTSDYQPDKLLTANAHYLLQKLTFNDLNKPGDFLLGLKSPQLEQAMAFCLGIYNVGINKNDFEETWPIVPLSENVWKLLNEADRNFMRTFTSFYHSYGGVPQSAIDHFPRTKIITSERQQRSLLGKMIDFGLINKKPLVEESTYECSKKNIQFFGWK